MPKEVQKVTKSETKKRTKKDPDAPKRGLSAYMFFSQKQRAQIKADNPDASFGTIGKLLGEAWKSMDDNAKKPYNEKAKADKLRYEEEKAALK